jgi:putative sugar O-methyltransferase
VPFQLRLEAFKFYGLKAFGKKAIKRILSQESDRYLKSAILDDLAILEKIGAGHLVNENPVLNTPGVADVYFIREKSINMRWMRYLYLCHQILSHKLLQNDDIWLDIGPFYGGLQGLVKKYLPNVRSVLVDFHHQLCRSYVYLSSLYPDVNHIFPDAIRSIKNLHDLPAGSFVYVPARDFAKICHMSCELSTNFVSFGEMKKTTFLEYYNSNIFQKSKRSYLVNRFVSAPFFEKTYDSESIILDYLKEDKKTLFFNIFPMHIYLLTKRMLFDRSEFRPISSQYFELIFSGLVSHIN